AEGAVAGGGHHAVADLDVADLLADFGDLAGTFHAGREGEGRLELVLAGDHQGVGEIQAGGMHLDAHVARAECRQRQVFQAEALGSAPGLAHHRLHRCRAHRSSPFFPCRADTEMAPSRKTAPHSSSAHFGDMTMVIWRPSILGVCSTLAFSPRSSRTRSSSFMPSSWCAISRPRKRRVTFTLSPSSRKRCIAFIFTS